MLVNDLPTFILHTNENSSTVVVNEQSFFDETIRGVII